VNTSHLPAAQAREINIRQTVLWQLVARQERGGEDKSAEIAELEAELTALGVTELPTERYTRAILTGDPNPPSKTQRRKRA